MGADRFSRVILTVIALELLWLGVKETAPPVAAQAEVTRVVIAGVQMAGVTPGVLPITFGGRAVKIEADRPIKVEAERPLLVQSVEYAPKARPGQ
jgi:hypothetical protein